MLFNLRSHLPKLKQATHSKHQQSLGLKHSLMSSHTLRKTILTFININ